MATKNITSVEEFVSTSATAFNQLEHARANVIAMGKASGRDDNTQALKEAWSHIAKAQNALLSLTVK